nr:AMP-binding protein [Cohnella faecalis]
MESESLTYAELNGRANQLARVLRGKGVGADRIVGILAERSLEMIVGILGILKAGGAYLPIDPDYPAERIGYMLEDSGADILLTQKRLQGQTMGFAGEVLHVDDERLYALDNTDLDHTGSSKDLAYVIYTSGSTGKPKGVMIEQDGVINALLWRKQAYGFNETHSVLQLFSYSFDGFVTSFFTPILSGARAILLQDTRNPYAIVKAIATSKVSHFICVPSLFQAIQEYLSPQDAEHLQVITLAGEKADSGVIEKRLAGTDILNS